MDVNDQIRKLAEFLEKNCYAELLEKIRKGEPSLIIDFQLLIQFDPELGDLLLDQPDEIFKAFELAVEQLSEKTKNFTIRIKNLPSSNKLMIRNIRSIHLGKLFQFEGIVRNKGNVRPHVTNARFECPSCGNILAILQLDNKFKEPYHCSCGRKGKFRMVGKELVDAQGLILEEVPEQLEGNEQPKRLNVFLKNDLVSSFNEKKTNPGSKIYVVGVIKEIPIITKSGVQSTEFDILLETNHVEPIEQDYSEITISQEDMKKIQELSQDPNLMKKLVSSVAPSIYGHEKIKEALLLQLAGGVRKSRDDGTVTRGDIHILLVGDPGSGKSMLLKRVAKISPKGKFISGKGASGTGLTATVVKDDFLQGWSLEAGALVLANKGLCAIDELDKISQEDRAAMHESLEGQTVTISKANIQATLKCETTVLAAANPKFGRFDPYETIFNQINITVTLLNRFDLIFPVKDIPDQTKDDKLAKFILELHRSSEIKEQEVNNDLLRKYLAYAKQNVFPQLTQPAIDEIKEYFLKMRSSASGEGVKSIPISARQLEGLIRLSEASARIKLTDKVTKKDARKAIELLDFCLRQVAFDEETGTIDIDRIATETPSSQRSKIIAVKEVLVELEAKFGKQIPLEEVEKLASEKGVDKGELDELIQKLKRAGDIFEPKHGFVSRI